MRNTTIITSAIAALSLISVVAQASELAVGYGVKPHQKFSLDAEVFFNHGLDDDNQSLRLPEEYGESGFLTDQNLDADGNSYGVRIKPAYWAVTWPPETCRTSAGPIDHEALVADASIRTMPFKGRIIGTLSFRIFIRAHALFAGGTGRRHRRKRLRRQPLPMTNRRR